MAHTNVQKNPAQGCVLEMIRKKTFPRNQPFDIPVENQRKRMRSSSLRKRDTPRVLPTTSSLRSNNSFACGLITGRRCNLRPELHPNPQSRALSESAHSIDKQRPANLRTSCWASTPGPDHSMESPCNPPRSNRSMPSPQTKLFFYVCGYACALNC